LADNSGIDGERFLKEASVVHQRHWVGYLGAGFLFKQIEQASHVLCDIG
jgi:hypothetical protein